MEIIFEVVGLPKGQTNCKINEALTANYPRRKEPNCPTFKI